MKATFVTDGNWDEKRRRIVRERMLPSKVLEAESLEEAIEYFKSQVTYLDEIESFEYFVIDNKKIYSSFWEK